MLSDTRPRQTVTETEKDRAIKDETDRALENQIETQNKRRDRSPNRCETRQTEKGTGQDR